MELDRNQRPLYIFSKIQVFVKEWYENIYRYYYLTFIIGSWLQILLDDVKVSEQLLDVVFYMLIVFAGFEQVLLNPDL